MSECPMCGREYPPVAATTADRMPGQYCGDRCADAADASIDRVPIGLSRHMDRNHDIDDYTDQSGDQI